MADQIDKARKNKLNKMQQELNSLSLSIDSMSKMLNSFNTQLSAILPKYNNMLDGGCNDADYKFTKKVTRLEQDLNKFYSTTLANALKKIESMQAQKRQEILDIGNALSSKLKGIIQTHGYKGDNDAK